MEPTNNQAQDQADQQLQKDGQAFNARNQYSGSGDFSPDMQPLDDQSQKT